MTKILIDRNEVEQALETLETCDAAHISDGGRQWYDDKAVEKAITTLRAALAEPVAYSYHPCTFILIEALKEFPNGKKILAEWDEARAKVDALQAAPPPRPAEPVHEPVRCPLCNYQYGHQIGCKNNPVDIALAAAQPRQPAKPVQEPVAWGCFKDGELQSELVGTKADVDFWVASDEPHMQGMVAGPLYTALRARSNQ